ncbi:hypothetical protein DPMN_105274 [Dreissena polymorpha]|uniref:TIR domain-containing protein n=1 Tax=Dreissena polymorpha TaxID=45954 RepID=A0A9D4HBI5_DREPO|nr:hypothetical protein DPMN_105274 [Dreissena polymorpha]
MHFSSIRHNSYCCYIYPDNCDLYQRLKIIIPVASVVVILIIVVVIVFKFRYEIQVIAFYKWHIRLDFVVNCGKCRRKKPEACYTYDAFVCFTDEDTTFVKDTLVPLLEPEFKLCVYYRDFKVGDNIADAILKGIKESAVTIILLSESFLTSRWGRFEFREAHHHMIFNNNKKLVIIIMEQAILSQRLDLTLRSILYTKKYLECWDTLFKEKLLHLVDSLSKRPEPREDDPLLTRS